MMSDHCANPVFFNNKKKDWKSRTVSNPHPLRPITSHFRLTPPTPLKMDVICVSHIILLYELNKIVKIWGI